MKYNKNTNFQPPISKKLDAKLQIGDKIRLKRNMYSALNHNLIYIISDISPSRLYPGRHYIDIEGSKHLGVYSDEVEKVK